MKKTSISMLLAVVLATVFAVSGTAAPVAASDSVASDSAASDIPPECDSYIKKLEVCTSEISASNPEIGNQLKQILATFRQQLSVSEDKATLGKACKQVSDQILPQLAKAGCN